MRRLGFSLVLLGATATDAQAQFQCIPVRGGALTQVWTEDNRCLPFHLSSRTRVLDGDDVEAIVLDSFAQWSDPGCTDLSLVYRGRTRQRVGFDPSSSDNQNVVTAVEDESELVGVFDDPRLIAITETTHATETGEIFDADIILNAARYRFEDVGSELTCRARRDEVFDLKNTLVHEVGHFLGFDHTPDEGATMFLSAPTCETRKADLNATDLDGLCQVYASGRPSMTCSPPESYRLSSGDPTRYRRQCARDDSGGCTSAGAEPAWLLLLSGLGFARIRRRRLSEK